VAGQTFADRVQQFRDAIGISSLKYGAAYAPYLKSSIPRAIRFRDIVLRRGTPAAPVPAALTSLTSDNNLLQLILDLGNARTTVDSLNNILKTGAAPGILTGTNRSFEEELKGLFDALALAANPAAAIAPLRAVYAFLVRILASLKGIKDALPAKVSATPVPASAASSVAFVLRDDLASLAATTGVLDTFRTLGRHSNEFAEGTPTDELITEDPATATTELARALDVLGITAAQYDALTDPALDTLYNGATDAAKIEEARKAAAGAMSGVIKYWNAVRSAAESYEKTFDDSLEAAMGLYKQIKTAIAASASVLPPSAAVAGVYCRVDNARGVWKAPANESLNSVFGPVVQITAEQQGGLNVDAVAGKSINAIRTFTGKGTLVWGARTLAGNDNEWRYVNVRRFFNMVEESSRKSTEPFVFEANDANTWVKVQGMLENFLTVLWRQGALQGAKPEHAFYVAVGLGKTMTSLDILEGRMIVEIGMAAVRPAEFIILQFSHKLAVS
jgi:hypothetical protein